MAVSRRSATTTSSRIHRATDSKTVPRNRLFRYDTNKRSITSPIREPSFSTAGRRSTCRRRCSIRRPSMHATRRRRCRWNGSRPRSQISLVTWPRPNAGGCSWSPSSTGARAGPIGVASRSCIGWVGNAASMPVRLGSGFGLRGPCSSSSPSAKSSPRVDSAIRRCARSHGSRLRRPRPVSPTASSRHAGRSGTSWGMAAGPFGASRLPILGWPGVHRMGG